jgi:hypothetical protein
VGPAYAHTYISRPIGRRAGGPARCKARSAKEIAMRLLRGVQCAIGSRAPVRGGEGSQRGCEVVRGIFRDRYKEEIRRWGSLFRCVLGASGGRATCLREILSARLSSLLKLFVELYRRVGGNNCSKTHIAGDGYWWGNSVRRWSQETRRENSIQSFNN